ncbi:hypothetical protein CLOM_g10473 [Closterium sp. NIES-68]|nr:hypothetical protein CLOM_g10473 [Closterium sp. NIES-68]GJP74062.1 hypothetical protein CLOP_g4703 [Closterium sp. NIES-67]
MASNASVAKLGITASTELSTRYTLLEFLGEGQYGTVWRCQERATGDLFALKYVDLTKCSKRARLAALSEVEILYKIRDSGFSDSVVTLKDVYGDDDSLYLVMELCTGGDLLELIQKQPGAFLSEAESRHVFASVARAVKQCHVSNIVHRDIKPENILLAPISAATADNGAADGAATSFAYIAKLADFGLAVDVPWWQQIRGYAGSKPYEAPEVMAGVAYDESADIWSLGVTLYAMLSGKWPLFKGGKRVLDEKADFASDDWKNVSDDARDLIRRMLRVDVNERFTIDEVLAHPWVAGRAAAAAPIETAAPEDMETVDLSDELSTAVVSQSFADITSGIAGADSESTGTSTWFVPPEAKSVANIPQSRLVPDTKRSETADSTPFASNTNSTDSDGGSSGEKRRWGGKLSPRTVLNRVMKVFSPLTRQREVPCIPIEVL